MISRVTKPGKPRDGCEAGFRRQDYADTEIKDIFGSSQTVAASVYPVCRFIHMAWDIGPEASAA